MKKSLTALILLVFGLMVVGRAVISAEDQPELLAEEVILEDVILEEATPDSRSIFEESDQAMDESESSYDAFLQESVQTVEEDDLIEIGSERELSQGIELIEEELGEDLITLTLDDVPLQDVIRMFTRISGANIVAGTNLHGSVTVSLRDVEWRPALEVILDSVDMSLVEKQNDIFTIMSQSDLAKEPVIADTIILEYVTVSNVYPVVKGMLISSNASVTAVAAANALVVQETVERLALIKKTVAALDTPRDQVFIEAKFVELNDSYSKQVGIDWEPLRGYSVTASGLGRSFTETQTKQRQDAMADIGLTTDLQDNSYTRTRGNVDADTRSVSQDNLLNAVLSDTLLGSAQNSFTDSDSQTRSSGYINNQVFARGNNFDSFKDGVLETVPTYFSETVQSAILSADDFTLTLSALEDNSGVSIVSNPKVIVANGESATIHVGVNEPNIVAVPTGDTGDRFAYTLDDDQPFIEIGVKVEVTPQVNTESNITVRIVPELSRLIGYAEVGVAGVSFPRTQIRKIITEFNLASGYTVAIGGLTETSDQDTVKKIPLLGDIPVIGRYLFSHTSKQKVQDEVVIFVTVGLANPESLVEVTGVPQESRLIHQHMAKKALENQNSAD